VTFTNFYPSDPFDEANYETFSIIASPMFVFCCTMVAYIAASAISVITKKYFDKVN